MVEVRLAAFAGHTDLKKLNFHVLFSDDVPVDTIQQFFLNRLTVDIKLTDERNWCGSVGTTAELEQLGHAFLECMPADRRPDVSPLRAGFMTAAVGMDVIEAALAHSVFAGHYMTGLGFAETSQMRLDGAGAAQKKDAINRANFILTATPSAAKYNEHLQNLRSAGINDRLIHASDAHYYADSTEPNRLGQSFCWIKADLTFEGLQRALLRFDDRVYTGDLPEKLDRVARGRTKYIKSLSVTKRPGSTLQEQWFDGVAIELNPGMVAIIGNQGSGKSALTDVIAHCGYSCVDEFSFLTPSKFCDGQRKAREFVATLQWEDGQPVTRSLDEPRAASTPERVRYVPQQFFDVVTNEKEVQEGGRFYGEVEKTIFSQNRAVVERATNVTDLSSSKAPPFCWWRATMKAVQTGRQAKQLSSCFVRNRCMLEYRAITGYQQPITYQLVAANRR